MIEKYSSCFLCRCNCGMAIQLDENNKIIKILGDKENPRTKGYMCHKGLNQAAHIDSPHRLTKPLKREGDRLVETTWDEALDGIGREIKRIKKKYGARAVSLAMGGSCETTIQFMLAYQVARAIGSRNLFSPVGLEMSSKYLANQKIFGSSQMDGFPDFGNAEYTIIIGANPVISSPLEAVHLKKINRDPERKLVVVDPRFTETARLADIHLPIRPSTDIYFIMGIINVLIKEKLYDEKFVNGHTVGLDQVKLSASRFTPEAVEKVTGINRDKLLEVARGFGKAKTGVLFYNMGLIANHHSTLISWAVQTIMLITNRIQKIGGSLLNPTLLNFNANEKMAFGGKKYISRVRGFEEICGFLPVTVLQDEILTPGEGQIRAMIVTGCNPLRNYTDTEKMKRAFGQLELLVSIDLFLTETGRKAHWVLPACSFHEQENVGFGFHSQFPEPFVQLTEKIREPLGESRPEWMIYRDIVKSSGVYLIGGHSMYYLFCIIEGMRKLFLRNDEYDHQNAITRLLARAGGTSYKEMRKYPHGYFLIKKKPYNYLNDIRHRDKKAHLGIPEFLSAVDRLIIQEPVVDKKYPFILSTTCRTWANINNIYQNEEWIKKNMPVNCLIMHPDDAVPLGINDGSSVIVSTRTARSESPVMFSSDVLKGTVYLSHGWGLESRGPGDNSGKLRGTPASLFLPDDEGDAFTGLPLFSGVPCRVERTG